MVVCYRAFVTIESRYKFIPHIFSFINFTFIAITFTLFSNQLKNYFKCSKTSIPSTPILVLVKHQPINKSHNLALLKWVFY